MSEQTPSRAEALRSLEALHTEVVNLVSALSVDDLIRPNSIGGGSWSAADLLRHLATWNVLTVQTLEDWRGRRYPRLHERFADAGNVDELNRRLDDENLPGSDPDAVAVYERVQRELVDAIESVSDAEWNEAPYYEPPVPTRSLGELLGNVLGARSGLFAHANDHLGDLRAYVESRQPGS